MPPEEYFTADDYQRLHGKWEENGRGDKPSRGPGGVILFKKSDSSLPWRKVRIIINQSVRETEQGRSEDVVDQRLMAQRHRLAGQAMGLSLGDEDADDNAQGDGAGDIVQAPRASRSQQATDTQPRGNPGAKAKAKAKAKIVGRVQTQDADGGDGGSTKTPKKGAKAANPDKGRKHINYSEHIGKSLKQLRECGPSE